MGHSHNQHHPILKSGAELLMAFIAGLGLGGVGSIPEVQDFMLDIVSITAGNIGDFPLLPIVDCEPTASYPCAML